MLYDFAMEHFDFIVVVGIGLYIAFAVRGLRGEITELRKQVAELARK